MTALAAAACRPSCADRRRLRHDRHVPRHDRAGGAARHAGPVRLGRAHGGPGPCRRPARIPAAGGSALAARLDRRPRAGRTRSTGRRTRIGTTTGRAGSWTPPPSTSRPCSSGAGPILRSDRPCSARCPARETGHGLVDARPAASVRPAALRLGQRDGGLVGHPSAARPVPPQPGPPVLFYARGRVSAVRQWPPGEAFTRYFYLDGRPGLRTAAGSGPPDYLGDPGVGLAAGTGNRSGPATAGRGTEPQ